MARSLKFRKKRNCTIRVAKTKVLISFAVTVSLFSHNVNGNLSKCTWESEKQSLGANCCYFTGSEGETQSTRKNRHAVQTSPGDRVRIVSWYLGAVVFVSIIGG